MNQVKSVSAVKYFFVKIAHWLKKKAMGKLYLTVICDSEEAFAKVDKLKSLLTEVRAQIKEINKTKIYIDTVRKEHNHG